jgi:hypothetical protein
MSGYGFGFYYTLETTSTQSLEISRESNFIHLDNIHIFCWSYGILCYDSKGKNAALN